MIVIDILIKNGRIINGTGNPWFKGNIAIKDGKIMKVGHISTSDAKRIIDVERLIVAPGFIDIHSHSDIVWLERPTADEKVLQGVTTELIGQCGFSVAPIKEKCKEEYRQLVMGVLGNTDVEWNWNTLAEYLAVFELQGIAVNIASSVGHGVIRFCTMGMDNRPPTNSEIEEMKQSVAKCFIDGAFAFSTGLIYPPLTFASTEEIIELCKVVKSYNGFLSIHMRNESDKVIESIHEVIKIGKETGIPIEISHFKAAGKQNWGKVTQTLKLVEDARAIDIDITVDQYPYTAGSTTLTAILPPWVHVGGKEKLIQRLKDQETREQIKKEIKEGNDWDNYAKASGWDGILITSVKTDQNKDLEGKTLSEIAEMQGTNDPAETAFNLLIEEDAAVSMVLFFMDEDDVKTVMKHQVQMVGTDSIIIGKYHPRAIASYPKILKQYVRENAVLTLPEAIRKMTSLPAQKIGLQDRGLLLSGFAADLTIFDATEINDIATYNNPLQFPKGIKFVIVNGELVVEEGKHTRTLPGRILRRTDYL